MVWPFDFVAFVCFYRIGSLGLQATASDFKMGVLTQIQVVNGIIMMI